MSPGPIRTAIVGFGTSGRVFHAPFLDADPDFTVAVIVTRDAARRAEALRRYPDAQVVDSVEDVWDLADTLELVVIGSPSGTHAGLAADALDAGLDVVVDKPFAVTAAEGRSLIDRAARLGRVLTVFQNRRWDGDFQTVKGLIDEGRLGEVRRFESRFEWFAPNPPTSWKTAAGASEGSGVLHDLGTHLIDQALQLFGPVEDVYAELDRRRGHAAADDVFLALRHISGVISHLWMNAVAPVLGPRFHVHGTLGGYTSWGLDGQEAALDSGARPSDIGFGDTPEERWGVFGAGTDVVPVPTVRGDYGAFYRMLAASIRTGAPLPVDPRDAVAGLEIIERALATARG